MSHVQFRFMGSYVNGFHFVFFNSQLLQLGAILTVYLFHLKCIVHSHSNSKHYCPAQSIVTVGQDSTFYYDLYLKRQTFCVFKGFP